MCIVSQRGGCRIILEKTALGIELGSARIKAVLIDENFHPLATGSHDWESRMENGMWTYSLEGITAGLQDCYLLLGINMHFLACLTLHFNQIPFVSLDLTAI